MELGDEISSYLHGWYSISRENTNVDVKGIVVGGEIRDLTCRVETMARDAPEARSVLATRSREIKLVIH